MWLAHMARSRDEENDAIHIRTLLTGRRGFAGGLWLARTFMPGGGPISDLMPAQTVAVPLADGAGDVATPTVQPGQAVRAGQCVGRAPDGFGRHAPVDGTVMAIGRVDTAIACDVPAVAIAPGPAVQGNPTSVGPPLAEPPTFDALCERLAAAGVVNTGGARAALHRQLIMSRRQVEHVIVNSLESQPPLAAQRRLLACEMAAVIDAAEILFAAVGAKRIWLTVQQGQHDLTRELVSLSRGRPVRVVPLQPKYPQEAPVLLVKSVLNRALPPGVGPLSAGILVVDVATVLAVGAAFGRGQPDTHRLLSVGGVADQPGCYRVPIGMRVGDLLDQTGLRELPVRVVLGGPMTGRAVADLGTVVTHGDAAVLPLARAPASEPIACVRCGRCIQHCPAGLDPLALLAAAEVGARDVARLYPQACMDCGLCSLVCPSHLPLLAAVQRLKASPAGTSVKGGAA